MKRLLFLTICFGLMAIGLQAAPPLRVLMPMKTANGTIAAPLAKAVSPFYGDTPCPSQSLIGEGNYLQHSGSPRVLTILAAYQDLDFTVNNPVQAFEQYLNGDVQEDLAQRVLSAPPWFCPKPAKMTHTSSIRPSPSLS